MSGLEIQRVESKFFDLDDIISKSESTSCSFEVGELNPEFFQEMLGILRPTQNADGYSADTPLWLLESVKTPFSIHLPQAYSANTQGVLKADCKKINLFKKQQHFYTNGIQLCQLMKISDPESTFDLSKCLVSALTQRLGGIIQESANQQNKDDKFDRLERKVFAEAKRCKEDIDNWLRQDNRSSSKKRKRNS